MFRVQRDDSATANSLAWKGLIALCAGLVLFGIFKWWQYPPAVEFDNLKYIQLLRTAVSAERPDWVSKVRVAIDQRVTEGAMSQRERSHFERILQLADTRKWDEAHRVCFQFEEAQLNRRRTSPPAESHSHQHEHH